ncbi:NAD-dependent deacylase [Candidatus Amoebophilus asiaticus]|nr:NAD-dependent deacylase [Candidatus Amoebophilus asiaticus]
MKKVVVLTGAGVSAESGLKTFRDSGGLWEGHDVTTVASPEGWAKDQELVLNFYNERRRQAKDAKPNAGHLALVKLEAKFDVTIITQNVDDLHERAGSKDIIHLHGELFKSRSTVDPALVYDLEGTEINIGDLCDKGSQLRPHIVWFGEMVPMMEVAAQITQKADILIVVGTSMVVYPAAGLIDYVNKNASIYIIDPNMPPVNLQHDTVQFIEETSAKALPELVEKLLQ